MPVEEEDKIDYNELSHTIVWVMKSEDLQGKWASWRRRRANISVPIRSKKELVCQLRGCEAGVLSYWGQPQAFD